MDSLKVRYVDGDKDDLVGEGKFAAFTEDVSIRKTTLGKRAFLVCRITSSGKDHKRTVDFLLPRNVVSHSSFFREFLKPICGSVDEVKFSQLSGLPCDITVKHVHKKSGIYANVVSIRPRVTTTKNNPREHSE